MKPGRKPKPTQQKIDAGLPGKQRLSPAEPKPPISDLRPPAWVDGATLQVWNTVAPMASGMGVLTVADVEALARYCDGIVLWQRARRFLHERGSTYPIRAREAVVTKDADGNDVVTHPITSIAQYPQVAEYRQLSKLLLAFEAEFGLTPSSRTRVEVSAPLVGHTETPEDAARREFFKSNAPKQRHLAGAG